MFPSARSPPPWYPLLKLEAMQSWMLPPDREREERSRAKMPTPQVSSPVAELISMFVEVKSESSR